MLLMIAEEIRTLQSVNPFQPYTVHTADGHELFVKHPDYCFVTPGNDTLYVFSDEIRREIVATRNVTRVVPVERQTRPRKR